MKQLLADAALKSCVVGFIKAQDNDKDLRFPRNKDGNPIGFTGAQKVMMVMELLAETVFTEMTPQQFTAAVDILQALGNDSQARQAMEAAGVLAASEGGRRGLEVSSLAERAMQRMGITQKQEEASEDAS